MPNDRWANSHYHGEDRLNLHIARFRDETLNLASTAFEQEILACGIPVRLTDAAAADMILIVSAHNSTDWRLRELRAHPSFREHRDKTVVYDQRDRPWCWAAGAYTCMPRRGFRPEFQVSVGYQWLHTDRLVPLQDVEPDLLFSFAGRRTHRCREIVLDLSHPRGLVVDADQTPLMPTQALSSGQLPPTRSYEGVLARGKFVLCPRGHGTGSFRVFEALAAGRVPVIISDEYVLPEGPDWPSCSLRVDEGDYQIAEMLMANEERFQDLSQAAAQAHSDFFSQRAGLTALLKHLHRMVADGIPLRVPKRGIADRYVAEIWTRNTLRSAQHRLAHSFRARI